MNISQLKTFTSLAKTLSYTETARALFISQPAVTQQVAKLEEEIGVRLFDRSNRGVRLTAAGRSYYEDCLDILARIDAAAARAHSREELFDNRLRLGCASPEFLLRAKPLITWLHTKLPTTQLQIIQGETDALIGNLCRGELDAFLGGRGTGTIPAGLSYRHLIDASVVVVAQETSPLATLDAVRIEDLNGLPLVWLENSRCPDEMRDLQTRLSMATPESPVSYCGSELIGATMAAAGVGAAVMPEIVCPEMEGLFRAPLEGIEPLSFGIFWRTSDEGNATRLLVEMADRML